MFPTKFASSWGVITSSSFEEVLHNRSWESNLWGSVSGKSHSNRSQEICQHKSLNFFCQKSVFISQKVLFVLFWQNRSERPFWGPSGLDLGPGPGFSIRALFQTSRSFDKSDRCIVLDVQRTTCLKFPSCVRCLSQKGIGSLYKHVRFLSQT